MGGEENKGKSEAEATVTDKKVTDEDLVSALEAPAEEVKVEAEEEIPSEQPKEEPKEEPKTEILTQEEKTRFGRNLKRQQDMITDLSSKVDMLLQHISGQRKTDEEVPQVITTYEDFEKAAEIRDKKQVEKQKAYERDYSQSFRRVSLSDNDIKDNEELQKEVFNTMFKDYNVITTGNPKIDAELNFAHAKAAVFSRKLKTAPEKLNLKQDKTGIPTNISVDTKEKPAEKKTPKLDPLAEDFIKSVGMSEESVRDALK